MNIKKIHKDQPDKFEFDSKNLIISKEIIKKYPKSKQQSALVDQVDQIPADLMSQHSFQSAHEDIDLDAHD